MCSEQNQIQGILNQYKKAGYLDEDTANRMLELKKRIVLSKEKTVSSVKKLISMLYESIKEKEIELWHHEQEKITKLESLIRGCSDSEVLTKKQLAAYNDVWNIHDRYSDKE